MNNFMNVTANKRLGQHFLQDVKVLQDIAKTILDKNPKYVLEIGPGMGALTQYIIPYCPVYAIERDTRFQSYLQILQKKYGNLQVIYQDILKFNLGQFFEKNSSSMFTFDTIFGNLPYNISTAIMLYLTKYIDLFNRCQFLLQKEVAERAHATSGSSYGRFSIMIQLFFFTELGPIIPASAFSPSPKVKSQVLYLIPKRSTQDRYMQQQAYEMDKLIKLAFSNRRKMISNTLSSIRNIKTILESLHIRATCRPEDISLIQYCKIYETMIHYK